jgi:hypothetical protein
MAVTRLSGGLTPANGSDPRTFPAIWNATADDIEAAEASIGTLQTDVSGLQTTTGTLANQSVRVYDDATARDAAITSPTEGMVVYLKDSDQLQKYIGTAWRSVTSAADMPAGSLVETGATTFTAVTSVSLDNVFSADYDTYKIFVTFSTSQSSVNTPIDMRLRTGGVNNTGTYGITLSGIGNGFFALGTEASNLSLFRLGSNYYNDERFSAEITMFNPFRNDRQTQMLSQAKGGSSANGLVFLGQGRHFTNTSFDGFQISFTTMDDGNMRVYGVKN